MKRVVWATVAFLLTLASVTPVALAYSITIDNPSFESPALADGAYNWDVEQWERTAPSGSALGTWNPGDGSFDTGVAMPDGEQVAFINSGYIWQTTDASLQAGTYTLDVAVGWQNGTPSTQGAPYGAVVLYQIDLSAPSPTRMNLASAQVTVAEKGTWEPVTVSYSSSSSSTNRVGVLLSRLTFDGNPQIDFDHVRLSFVPVPEPATLVLLGGGLIGLAALRGHRNR